MNDVLEVEYLALYDLYNATVGENWAWGQQPGVKWNFTGPIADPCSEDWEGITCTFVPYDGILRVAIIELNEHNLCGYLPSSLSNLSYLVELSLRNNNLDAGGIPPSIGELYRLRLLDLGSSIIPSSIPDVFASMISLQYLDLSVNQLTGEIPISLCAASNMTDINLTDNHLNGTIPECLAQLKDLDSLSMGNNLLFGTLPTVLSDLNKLTVLIVSSNALSGTIPVEYSQLRHLLSLDISNNMFEGTVPAFLGHFSELVELDMGYNFFSGTIPQSFGNLQSINSLVMQYNGLNGTYPQSMCNLTMLAQLDFNANSLTGTLPQCWSNFTSLQFIAVFDNQFSGTIPAEWANLVLLRECGLTTNHLTGTIPQDLLRGMTVLTALALDHNKFTGPLPGDIFQHQLMELLSLSHNRLTGPLPPLTTDSSSFMLFIALANNHLSGTISSDIRNYQDLLYFDVSNNAVSGTVPEGICDVTIVNYVYLTMNRLTGTLPDCLGHLKALSYLFVDSNLISGTVPPSIGAVVLLQSLNLSSNHLSGNIPTSLSSLPQLEVLLLQNNDLSGSLEGVFDPSTQLMLATIECSNNQLSGTLPDAMFRLPKLLVFAAVSNCFTGSLPTAICNSATLLTLALDGLQSATLCQNKLFSESLDGIVAPNLYSIGSPLTGGVLTCLFQMTNLTTLHLSGNGLTGTLPADITVSATLTDLSLSHNKLEGRIPPGFLSRNWSNLDLSYNVFTHSLSVNGGFAFDARSTITLQQNRLSGNIPAALSDVTSISILESNLFACNAQRSDLPHDDPDEDKYQCGSDAWNATIYAWLAIASVISAALVVLWWQRATWESEVTKIRKWWDIVAQTSDSAAQSSTFSSYIKLCYVVETVVKFSAACACFCLCVLLPLDRILCSFYGTYDHAYAWAFSAAYLSGRVPFGALFACLAVLMLCVSIFAARGLKTTSETAGAQEATIEPPSSAVTWNRIALYGSYLAINFIIVLGVNIAYVVIALNQNGEALTLAQISLALFKVAFNGVCSPLLIRWTSHRVLKSSEEASTADLIAIQLFVTLVNNILIPCLVVAIISPSCFYNIFNAASEVTSSFSYPGKCVSFDPLSSSFITCSGEEGLTAITSYNPPFAYSYQCSSSFITYYAPAYVIMCIIASFGIPVAQVLLQWLHSRAVKGTRWFALQDLLLPRILKPIYGVTPPLQRNVFAPYFDATQHMITLLTYVGLLLTFGAVFPPLALCFAVTIASIAAFTKLKVGRFLSQAVELDTPEYLTVVNQECEGVGSAAILARSIYMMAVFSCLFYTLFLFDTLGDAVGVGHAYWVLIVVPLMPVVLPAAVIVVRSRIHSTGSKLGPRLASRSFTPSVASETEMSVHSPLPSF